MTKLIKEHDNAELETYASTESILFTTDEMGEAVLIKEVEFGNEPIDVSAAEVKNEKNSTAATSAAGSTSASQSQFASATSLLQLAQQTKAAASMEAEAASQETVLLSTDSVIQISGQDGEYVLVTTDDDEQKFMPISHLTNLIANATSTTATSTPPAPASSSSS